MLRRHYPPITNRRAFSPERTPSPPPDLRALKRRRDYGPDNDPVGGGLEKHERRPVRPMLRNVALAERITFGHAPLPGGTVGGVHSYGNADDDDANGETYEDLNPESLPWYPFANARDAKSERPGKPGGSQGKPGAGGYSLPGTLNWDPASYKAVQLKLQVLSKALFNKTKNYEAQSVDAKSAYAKSALDMLPFLADYPNGWPADAFAEMYLKNTSDEFARRQKLYLALGTGKRKRTIQA